MSEENGIKLEENELLQLKVRRVALDSANTLFQMASREYQLYVIEAVKKAGVDPQDKQFEIDFETGDILEVKKTKFVKENGEE